MTGLLRKIFIEIRWSVLLFGLGLAVVMALLTILLPKVLADAESILERLRFVRPLLKALLGADPGDGFSQKMMQAFLWVHPTVLALVWGHVLMYCSRVPAGEIDRGSVDFLLGLPVSRWQLYFAETVGFVCSGIVMLSIGFLGHWLASGALQPKMRPGALATTAILLNLFAVYLAVGGVAFLVSACSDRRGRAIGIMFAILLLSFLLNFLAQFWERAEHFAFLSVISYYRPAKIISTRSLPWNDLGVLMTVFLLAWAAGGKVLRERSICTV